MTKILNGHIPVSSPNFLVQIGNLQKNFELEILAKNDQHPPTM